MAERGPKSLQLKVLWCFFFFFWQSCTTSACSVHGWVGTVWERCGRAREHCVTRAVRFTLKNSEKASNSAVSSHWMQCGLWGLFFFPVTAQHNPYTQRFRNTHCRSKHTPSQMWGLSMVYIPFTMKQTWFFKALYKNKKIFFYYTQIQMIFCIFLFNSPVKKHVTSTSFKKSYFLVASTFGREIVFCSKVGNLRVGTRWGPDKEGYWRDIQTETGCLDVRSCNASLMK